MEVARETVLERAREDRQIARRGDLLVVGKSRSVAVDRARHAERARLARHHVGEIVFVMADRLADRDRNVVRRTGHDRLDRVLDADRLARGNAELRGLLRGGVLGDRNLRAKRHCALVELFEQEVERHHLGDRSRMAQSVFISRVERPAAVGVDDDRGKRRRSGNGRDRRGRDVMIMRVMRDRVSAMVPIMMGLRGRAGDREGRGGDQRRRRQTNESADSRTPATQRHERALQLYATAEAEPPTVAPRTQEPTIWRRGYAAVNETPATVGILGQAIEIPGSPHGDGDRSE